MTSREERKTNQMAETRTKNKETQDEGQARKIPKVLPVLPLRELVLYPFVIMPLSVGRSRSVKALEEAMETGRHVLLVAQKGLEVDEPTPEDLFQMGTVGECVQMLRMPDGLFRVVVEGVARARILEYTQVDPCYKVRVEIQPELEEQSLETEALMRNVLAQFERVMSLGRNVLPEAVENARGVEDPGRLADLVASYLGSMKIEQKQQILETVSPKARLELLADFLGREIEILELDRKISSRVKKELEDTQREFYLREKMKAIQQELGERDERTMELDELRTQIKAAKMPQEVEERAIKEVDRLEKMPPASPEVVVVRTYLDWLIGLPWSKRTEDRLDINAAEKVLNEDHYGLAKIKERILEFLAVRKLSAKTKGPILCFIGPPGVGKTSIGKSIARALGRKFVRISLGGVRDEGEIRGHRRTYVGALPGRILQGMKTAGTHNPVFMMDEVDKIGIDFRGDPSAALLEVLDPEQNNAFSDHYLEVPFDLSEVMFITTGNFLEPIPPALKDRMEVLEFPGYIEEEKLRIAQLFLVSKQIEANGLKKEQLRFTESGLRALIRNYTREAGVRNLEREIASICRKVAKHVAQEKVKSTRLTASNLPSFLGPRRFLFGVAEKVDEIGVVSGLGVSDAGGDAMPVEVTLMKGRGKLILTGKLGEMMQESARAALSFVRSRARQLGIDEDFYRKIDIHIHALSGAVPKEGPSAGIAIASALVSALTRRPVHREVTMTGEVTLRGKVLPVGGVKEKVLAAHRAGLRTIILPKENERDLEEIPPHVQKDLSFKFVEHMDEVLPTALHDRPREQAALAPLVRPAGLAAQPEHLSPPMT
jgi:ATP-dependent Lon protease